MKEVKNMGSSMILDEHSLQASQSIPIPWIEDYVDKVTRSRFESYLRHLVSYPNRLSTSTYFEDAATWVYRQLEGMGYITKIENIAIGSGTSYNVIADKQGHHSD